MALLGVALLNQWWLATGGYAIPKNLIIPFYGTTVEDGWETFSLANSRLIVGAGNTYSPGGTGGTSLGSAIGSFSGNTGSGGGHTGTAVQSLPSGSATPTSLYSFYGGSTSGDHYHALGNVIVDEIDRTGIKLIKATVAQNKLPVNGVVLSAASMASLGMSNVIANNTALSGHTSTATFSKSGRVLVSEVGGHVHTTNYSTQLAETGGYLVNGYVMSLDSSGAHSTPFALTTLTTNLKRVLLSAWAHASESIEPNSGMIAMWESLVPPSGWKTCDGTNGSYDLRDCFIYPTTSGSEDTTPTGDNTVTCGLSGSPSHSATHSHGSPVGQYFSTNSTSSIYHGTESWSHSHSITKSGTFSFLPAYYALTFIQKI